jgi:hypothetical protein
MKRGVTGGPSSKDGLPAAIAAFEAIRAAAKTDPELFVGRGALPRSEAEARQRAARVLDVLAEARLLRPERFALVRLEERGERRWHVAPLYPLRIGAARMEGVADPFLRRAPLGMDEWTAQLKVGRVDYVSAAEVLAAREALVNAPITERGRPPESETIAAGQGSADDAHGLAKLLRAWLKAPDDVGQVERFRSLFGESTWRAMANVYPKLVHEVQAELGRRK